ncbi:MAG: hypothetical protein ACI4VQ_01645 [Clostridia bacterium]
MNSNVSNEEMRLARKAYYKRYRLKNKEKMQKAQDKFWTKQALQNRKDDTK